MDKLRWRVEHRNATGGVLNILEAANHIRMELALIRSIKEEWLLRGGDTIHIIRQTED